MRSEKQLLLDEMLEKVNRSNGFLVVKYKGLKSALIHQFRNAMYSVGGDFEVVRKRVFLKASEAATVSLPEGCVDGHVGIVFSHRDILETTKAITQFSLQNEDTVSILAGWIDQRVYAAAEVVQLSKLPALPEMRAQFLGLLEAPMAQTLAVMQALLTSVLYCLDNKSQLDAAN